MSNSTSTSNSNPPNSVNTSSSASRSLSPYGDLILHDYSIMEPHSPPQALDLALGHQTRRDRSYFPNRFDFFASNGASRPATPTLVYIVTSNFTSQTTQDGVRLSESDIVGFQILAVFARLEDANSYAEHECEEIDAGVRRRRSRRIQGRPVDIDEGEGIRAEAIVNEDGTISWIVEEVGHIEVGQWVVQ